MRLNLRCPDELLAQIRARCSGNLSEAVRDGLERYYLLLSYSRNRLAGLLSAEDLRLICDVCNGTLWDDRSASLVASSVADCEPEYFAKWGVDRGELMKKLKHCSQTDRMALVDAVERYWAAVGTGMPVDPARILEEVSE